MKEYYKFPVTKYIIAPENGLSRTDRVFSGSEVQQLLQHKLTIEEKIDGANLGISFSGQGDLLLQNRGGWVQKPYAGQWKKLEEWIPLHQDTLFDYLTDRYILFGEWCYAQHSLYYDRLPDWFIGFDIFDKMEEKFFSVERRNEFLKCMKISVIRQIGCGIYTLDELMKLKVKSGYGNVLCEGIYIRKDDEKWLEQRAKLVRKDFAQNIDVHWSHKNFVHNQLDFWTGSVYDSRRIIP